MSASNNKWILTVPKEIHLGFIKETFGRGAVIELDTDRGMLIIDGRKFEDTRDLELLQRASIKNPDRPWVIPYTDEAYQNIIGGFQDMVAEPAPRKSRPGEGMEIVQDDTSDHPVIDIRHTQISKQTEAKKQEARTAAHNREVDGKMEIIRGDESPEERIASLKGKSDMQSLQERVALKRKRAKMPIVHDDSLGMGVGKSEIPLNAGQHLPSREEADAKAEEQRQCAELRKQQVQMTRKKAGIEVPAGGAVSGEVDQDIPAELAEATEVVGGTTVEEIAAGTEQAVSGTNVSEEDIAALEADFEAKAAEQSSREAELEAENAELRSQNTELKETQSAILARLDALEATPKKRGPGRPKTATKVKRTPVSDKE